MVFARAPRLKANLRLWVAGAVLAALAVFMVLVGSVFLLMAAHNAIAFHVGSMNASLIMAAAVFLLALVLLAVKRVLSARAARTRARIEDEARAATVGLIKGLEEAVSENPASGLAASFAAGVAMGLRGRRAER